MKRKNILLPLAAFAGLALTASTASAALTATVLDLTANGGINPNTGVAWAYGDTYRLAFYTAGTTTATSNNPAFYNNFVTAQAHQNAALAGINFFALVSVNLDGTMTQADSPKINARENTGTIDLTGGAGIGGAGSPVFVMNGITAIARNNADIWDGFSDAYASGNQRIRLASGSTNLNSDGNEVTASANVHYSPFLNQFGLGDSANIHGVEIRTGSNADGTSRTPLGTTTDNTIGNVGASNANDPGRVFARFDGRELSLNYSFYALSEELMVIPEPSTGLLGALGWFFLLRRRRK